MTANLWPHEDENARIRGAALQAGIVLALVVCGGTVGYRLIEGWKWLDALYMTVITIATIGFGEIHPLSDVGRVFTMILVLAGVGNLGYALGEMTGFFANGGLVAYHRRERRKRMLRELNQHTIVCGCGRLGSAIVEALVERGLPVVVIDRDPQALERLHLQTDVPFLCGDANDDTVLERAGIHRARTLVAGLHDDAHNVFLTLSARVMTRETNPALVIHGKADDPASLVKLERAGATHVFSPSRVLGHRIAHQIVRPAITGLIDLDSGAGELELGIEEVGAAQMHAAGRRLDQSPVWGQHGLLVVGLKDASGQVHFPPAADRVLGQQDRVLVLGRPEQLSGLTRNSRA